VRRGQFDLDVVGITKHQHVDTKSRQIYDLPVGDIVLIEYSHSPFQLVSAADAEAEMIESDTAFVERVPADRPAWICGWTNRQERAAVAKDYSWPELPCYLKSKDIGYPINTKKSGTHGGLGLTTDHEAQCGSNPRGWACQD
jgi:hypothetical protein